MLTLCGAGFAWPATLEKLRLAGDALRLGLGALVCPTGAI
jgi:hypothetical protein